MTDTRLITTTAGELADACTKVCKGNPFLSPVVIFNDAKTEQWFKKYYLSVNSVFANIRADRIGNFIKDYLCKVQKEDIKFTSADILGHKLIVFIKQHIGEEQLKAVKAYCSGNDGRIFDLSMMLADLFMKYQSLDADVFADNANPHAQ